MDTEYLQRCSKGNQDVTQGGSLLTPHSTGVRNDSTDVTVNSWHSMDASVEPPTQLNTLPSSLDALKEAVKVRRSRRRRSGVSYGMFDIDSEGESHCELPIQVSQRWHPEDACRPVIDEAPTFHPTEEEFKDTLAYIAKIRHEAEKYGICRIIPPPSWKPPCPLKEKSIWDCAKFTTRIQQIDKLQNRDPVKKKTRNHVQRRRKRRRRFRFGMTRRRAGSGASENDCAGSDTDEKFGFQSGSDFSLKTFQEFADLFKKKYFIIDDVDVLGNSMSEGSQKRWEPSVEEIEGEYWRIVEKSTEEIEVHYGADLETGNFSSGFLKPNQLSGCELDPYALSGWNLNNFPRLSGSVLSLERSDISGVLVPWLYIGMCFSSFCWVWYGVAGSEAVKLEAAMKKHLPKLFEEQPHLLNELVTQLSPSVLKSEDVQVYRAVQHAGEFLLTFPRAYHAGFNCGFNCAEAVNVAPVDWLPQGQCAVELYSEQCRKTSLSHDKLLLGAALEAARALSNLSSLLSASSEILKWKDVCGKNGMLTRAVKERIVMEKNRREVLPTQIQRRRMDKTFDSDERECISCFYDLYLSATGCACSPNRFTCLNHMKFLCSCEPSRRIHLFRYDMDELNTLIEALEGDTNAMKKWDSGDRCVPEVMQLLNLDESTPTRVFNREGCSGGSYSRTLEPKAKRSMEFPTRCSQNQNYDYDCNGETEILPLKELLNCKDEGVTKVDKSNYQESGKMNSDEFVSPSLPPSFNADDLINCAEDACTIKNKTVFDLNLDGACLDSQEMSCRSGKMVIMEEQYQFPNSLGKTSSLLECTKASTSDDNLSPTSDPLWGKNHLAEQKLDSNSTFSQRLSSDLTASEIFPERNSSSSLRPQSAIDCHQSGGSMLFGFNLLPQQCGESSSDGQRIPNSSGSVSLNSGLHVSEVNTKHDIELLELGTVVPGKLWCNKEAIYPKGFKSRIKFISILDPCETCNYISEVLPGALGPLFKVTVEKSPDVSFISTSPTLCWESARRALQEKLIGCHSEGRCLLSIQALSSINGFEMFGFLLQPIIQIDQERSNIRTIHELTKLAYYKRVVWPSYGQAIEALDPHHFCTEYWEAKVARKLEVADSIWSPARSTEKLNGKTRTDVNDYQKDDVYNSRPRKLFGVDLLQKERSNMEPIVDEVSQVLGGLIRKASPRELDMLQDIFCVLPINNKRAAAFGKLLAEAKRKRFSYSGSC